MNVQIRTSKLKEKNAKHEQRKHGSWKGEHPLLTSSQISRKLFDYDINIMHYNFTLYINHRIVTGQCCMDLI